MKYIIFLLLISGSVNGQIYKNNKPNLYGIQHYPIFDTGISIPERQSAGIDTVAIPNKHYDTTQCDLVCIDTTNKYYSIFWIKAYKLNERLPSDRIISKLSEPIYIDKSGNRIKWPILNFIKCSPPKQ